MVQNGARGKKKMAQFHSGSQRKGVTEDSYYLKPLPVCTQAPHSSDTLVCFCLPQMHRVQHRGKAEKSTFPRIATVPEELAKLGYTKSSFKVQKGSLATPHTSNLESIPLLFNHRYSLKYCRNDLHLLPSKYSCFLSNKQ